MTRVTCLPPLRSPHIPLLLKRLPWLPIALESSSDCKGWHRGLDTIWPHSIIPHSVPSHPDFLTIILIVYLVLPLKL